jgi:hypothetical protein
MNCRQHFPLENTLLLKQEFWNLFFENCRTYGLDILRRLHMRGDGRRRKFIIIQGLDICKIAWYQIVGLLKLTYMLYKLDSKQGRWFLPHGDKGTHKLCM